MNEIYQAYPDRISKRKAWESMIQTWKQSGLALKTFCEQQQIKEADLKYWSYRLYNTASIKVLQESRDSKDTTPQFIPIALHSATKHHHADEDNQVDLIIEKNYCIRLKKHFDEQMLLKLIQVLRRQGHADAST